MTDSMNIDDIAQESSPGPEGESFAFEEIGDTVTGKVVHFGTFTSDNKFKPGQRDEILVISLEQADGSVLKVWPVIKTDMEGDAYADRMAKAIVAAIKAADKKALEVGATLAVKYSEAIPTKFPKPARGYQAEYRPPVSTIAGDTDGAVAGLISS